MTLRIITQSKRRQTDKRIYCAVALVYIPRANSPTAPESTAAAAGSAGSALRGNGPTDVFSISSWGWFHGYGRVFSKLYTLHTFGLLFVN